MLVFITKIYKRIQECRLFTRMLKLWLTTKDKRKDALSCKDNPTEVTLTKDK
ncbi:hypothetical protein Syun_031591 [Stephania yunnanensis]|uniref:Uncharacterized protein n=1 Tax=Stephania yunnanensis TaxID=152371 RepID=A0AAP0E3V4_9MAGN